MKRIHVLHIDDNPGDLQLAKEAFATCGATVRYEPVDEPLAAIGRIAEETIRGAPPELIVLDVNMPGLDGMDMLKLIGANRRLRRVPIVVLTSSERAHEREECLQLGAKAVFCKPATFEELCVTAGSILAIAHDHGAGKTAAAGA